MINRLSRFGQKFAETFAAGPVGRYAIPGPLELFQKEQRGKLAKFLSDSAIIGKPQSPGIVDGFFQGRNLREEGGDLRWGETDEKLAKMRQRAGFAIGGLMAANTLGIDPLGLTSAANGLAGLAAHATIGGTLYQMGGIPKVAGMAYLGAGLINTFRSGNNLGPQ